MIKAHRFLLMICLLLFSSGLGSLASVLDEVQKDITEFKLSNGIKVIILERHNAPVVSFVTYFDAGASNEVKGITGIAHVFEHMAFKGTTTIGTEDYKKEKIILDEMDRIFEEIVAEKKSVSPDTKRIEELSTKITELQKKAGELVINNQFVNIVNRNGGVGTNAGTSADSTMYIINLPSNRVELWAWIDSERILNPVIREFFKEKEVIKEERRMGSETRPIGRLVEDVLCTAFKAHPYGEPIIGHMSDIETVSRAKVKAFHDKYYVGNNMTIAIVGDVNPDNIKPILKKYFERIPAGEKAGRVTTTEPEQTSEKRVLLRDPSQSILIMAFHKPDIRHPDSAVYDVIQDILAGGKSSRLYEKMVKKDKTALFVGAFPGFPGRKYPNLFLFFGVPNSDHTNAEMEKGIWEEIENLKTGDISDEELKAVVTKARAGLYNGMLSNQGMARQLAANEVLTGDWRNLFKTMEDLQKVTKDDIKRVANECFTHSNLTVGELVHEAEKSKN